MGEGEVDAERSTKLAGDSEIGREGDRARMG